jgi:hypothetical protein
LDKWEIIFFCIDIYNRFKFVSKIDFSLLNFESSYFNVIEPMHLYGGEYKKNSIAYNDIQESITKHYEKTNQIKTMYDNYKNILKDKFKDSNNFIYNVMHCVNFGKKNKNFSITNNYKIIAHSDKYCIFFDKTTI